MFVPVKGEIPSPLDPPPGCHFHPRCPHVMPKCRTTVPPLVEIAPGRMSACWLNEVAGMTLHEAVRRHDPREPIPLVLDSPHSGETYPEDFDHAPPRSLVRQAEDTHVARLWSHAPAHGATLIEALFPRAYIDANRSLDDVDPELLADAWDEPIAVSAKTALGIGLVWRLARGGVPMYARRLRSDEVRSRIERCWRPYHAAVETALDERHREFGAVWHVNCHSMLAVGDELSVDPGRERADFVLGDRDGTHLRSAIYAARCAKPA